MDRNVLKKERQICRDNLNQMFPHVPLKLIGFVF